LRELNALLEQSAEDASTGLASAQSLLEALGVGLITIDRAGLVVAANLRAGAIIASDDSDLIGVPADVALPESLLDLIHAAEKAPNGRAAGRVVLEGSRLQCRVNPIEAADGCRGGIVALWEEVE
jgi:PAS domain-containing protein